MGIRHMKIWKLNVDANNVAWLRSVPMRTHEDGLAFDGRSLLNGWKKLPLVQIDEEQNTLPLADAVCSDACFLISEKAKQIIAEVVSDEVEFLPYDFCGITYYLINPMTILPCLNRAESKLLFSRNNYDRILIVKEFCLIESVIEGHQMFRMQDCPLKGPFVTDAVVESIRNAKLTGFAFELVWEGHKQKEGTKIYADGVLRVEH